MQPQQNGPNKQGSGWTVEGIERYNAIFDQVKEDREDLGGNFVEALGNYFRQTMHEQSMQKKRSVETHYGDRYVRARNDLDDEEHVEMI